MNKEYFEAGKYILENGVQTEPRGLKCIEVLGYKLVLNNPKERIITYTSCKTNTNYAIEELAWYAAKTNEISFSPKIQKIWEKYSDDGKTVNSAYGHRLWGVHPKIGIDQWAWCLNRLKACPDTRQAIMNINSAFDKQSETKDVPCCIAIQCFIRKGRLHWIAYWRSQDFYKGLRNDSFTFSALHERMSRELGVKLGTLTFIIGSLHIYEEDLEKIRSMILEGIKPNVEYEVSTSEMV